MNAVVAPADEEETVSELFVDSLRRRIGALHGLGQRDVVDLTLEQVNHHERPSVPPIAFS